MLLQSLPCFKNACSSFFFPRLFCMFGPNLTKCAAKVNTTSFCTVAVCPTYVYVDRYNFFVQNILYNKGS
ncbi:unnamed protein product [Ixodes pacificus]